MGHPWVTEDATTNEPTTTNSQPKITEQIK